MTSVHTTTRCHVLAVCLTCCLKRVRVKFTCTLTTSLHADDEGEKRKTLPVRARPLETPGYGGEREMCSPRRKPNERRLPVLRHQINFTLSHLPATVMSFIHPFPPRSHGNSAAWSSSFFYICLSLPPSSSLPLSRPQWTQPTLLHLRGVQLHPPASQASTLLLSTTTLRSWCKVKKKKKKLSRTVQNTKRGRCLDSPHVTYTPWRLCGQIGIVLSRLPIKTVLADKGSWETQQSLE